jgi:hypothetical protein
MSAHPCCVVAARGIEHEKPGVRLAEGDPHPPSFPRRSLDLVSRIVPVAILVVLPKCPACLVAYVALGTGIGISLTAATYMRMLLVVLCVTSLAYFALTTLRRKPGWMRIFRNLLGVFVQTRMLHGGDPCHHRRAEGAQLVRKSWSKGNSTFEIKIAPTGQADGRPE